MDQIVNLLGIFCREQPSEYGTLLIFLALYERLFLRLIIGLYDIERGGFYLLFFGTERSIVFKEFVKLLRLLYEFVFFLLGKFIPEYIFGPGQFGVLLTLLLQFLSVFLLSLS